MHLTLQTDYSLRMLLYLAVEPDRLSSVSEIAAAYRISRNHLVKVAHRLGQLGYLEAVRGRAGGLRLKRPAGEINIGEVVRAIERELAPVECYGPDGASCVIARACTLKGPLFEAQRAFLETLDRYTIAALIRDPAMAASLVQLRS